jgi:single-strand DNA-binding protein
MARSVNKVILIGNLGRDAETKYTPQGVAVSRFSIATTRRIKDNASGEWKDETDWNNVTLWRNENLAPYLLKGKQVYVEGRLQTRSYQDKDGNKKYATEVVAEDVILLGGRTEGGEANFGGMQSAPRSASQRMAGAPAGGGNQGGNQGGGFDDFDPGISDDDVPF